MFRNNAFKVVVMASTCVCLLTPCVTQAAILNVPGATYPTIQAAIDASASGDEIVVADGVYTGIGNRNLNFHGKAIVLRSEHGPASCIIDCQGSARGVSFDSGEGLSSVIDGLTIANARMTGGSPFLSAAA